MIFIDFIFLNQIFMYATKLRTTSFSSIKETIQFCATEFSGFNDNEKMKI